MTLVSAGEGIQAIALDQIHLSETGSQGERRRHFDKAAIAELAESIKTVGLLSPIIVRAAIGIDSSAGYQLVAGERRYLAAKQAGMGAINAHVRVLTDEQVLEIQLIENLQREGLHELAEAESYEALVKLGRTAEEIADKTGKSKAYVYARMKLLALSKASRKAFYAGKLNASTALLLARIPVEALQDKALKEITHWGDSGMSFRSASDHIHRNFMLKLADGGFPTENPDLVPAAGTCGACPKRTGNQKELFGDVKGADVCTDPPCFQAKRTAWAAIAIAEAEQAGQTVISGAAAKKIKPHDYSSQLHGYVELSERCWQDDKNRTYAQLLGKDFVPVLLQDPFTGSLLKVAPESALKGIVKTSGSGSGYSATQRAADKKRKLENKVRLALYEQIRVKMPEKLGDDDLRILALRFFDEIWNDAQKMILVLWGLKVAKRSDMTSTVKAKIGAMDDPDVVKFLFDCIFVRELIVTSYSTEKASLLHAAARKLKINPDKVRRDLIAAAAKPKTKAKAKLRAKSARKAK